MKTPRRSLRGAGWLTMLPPTIWLVVLFVLPVALVAGFSVGILQFPPTDEHGFTLETWRELFGGTLYLRLLWRSSWMALVVAATVVVVGYPIAYYLALVVRRHRYLLLLIVLAPFFTSYLLRVFAWKVVLGSNGVFNSIAYWAGVRSEGDPIPFLLYSKATVVLVLIYVWLPFAVLPIFATLENLDRRLLDAAADLGASRMQAFLHVTLPISLPGVLAAFMLVFIPSLGEFITPLLVGGATGFMYGNAIQELFTNALDWRTGSVLAMFLLLIVLTLAAVSQRFARSAGRVR